MRVEIRPQAFAPWQELAAYEQRLSAGTHGGCAAFVGSMRDFNLGAKVTQMRLQHYPQMTEKQLTRMVEKSIKKHQLLDVLVLHRVGELTPGEPIVLVAVWSAHRAQSFVGCREIMEDLKQRATLWKQETTDDGVRWVEGNTPVGSDFG